MERRRIIDVHAHVLPGVDDGSRDMEESCGILEEAVRQGVTAVIATPHYSRHRDNKGVVELTRQLEMEIQKTHPRFRIYPGQETYYHEELPERIQNGFGYTMAGSRYVLVEFDPGVPYQKLFRGLRKLAGAGYVPVLAHMERYGCLREEKNLRDLLGCGCLLQMNYESLQGPWFREKVRWCRKQVLEGRIHLLGTDMHRMDFRPPRITEAFQWLDGHISAEGIERMTWTNPMRIINNENIS